MKVEVRNDSVFISGYVNAVERLSKPIRETLHGKIRSFVERIKAGVFRKSLKRNDNVLVLLNHNYEKVLASTKDGNAILEEDNIGLRAEITITDKEVVQKAREGKLSGWSFGFVANDDEITNEANNPHDIRTVTDLELLEVSILDETKAPAYYGTSIEAREGGAKVVEIRAENFTNEQTEGQAISIDELATLVAAKVIEALKTESKADETEQPQDEPTDEPQAEETVDEPVAEPQAEPQAESEEQTDTDEPVEDKPEDEPEESRAIDYSSYEERLAKLKK